MELRSGILTPCNDVEFKTKIINKDTVEHTLGDFKWEAKINTIKYTIERFKLTIPKKDFLSTYDKFYSENDIIIVNETEYVAEKSVEYLGAWFCYLQKNLNQVLSFNITLPVIDNLCRILVVGDVCVYTDPLCMMKIDAIDFVPFSSVYLTLAGFSRFILKPIVPVDKIILTYYNIGDETVNKLFEESKEKGLVIGNFIYRYGSCQLPIKDDY